MDFSCFMRIQKTLWVDSWLVQKIIQAKEGFKDRPINPQSSFCCIVFYTHLRILYGFIFTPKNIFDFSICVWCPLCGCKTVSGCFINASDYREMYNNADGAIRKSTVWQISNWFHTSNRTMPILTVNSDFIRCAHAGRSEVSAPEDVNQLVMACRAALVWITMGSVQAAPDPGHWKRHISHHILYMKIRRISAVPVTLSNPLCSHSVAQHTSLSKSADFSWSAWIIIRKISILGCFCAWGVVVSVEDKK